MDKVCESIQNIEEIKARADSCRMQFEDQVSCKIIVFLFTSSTCGIYFLFFALCSEDFEPNLAFMGQPLHLQPPRQNTYSSWPRMRPEEEVTAGIAMMDVNLARQM